MTESPEYHLGRRAALADIEAGREQDEMAGLVAPLDWLRGYDDTRAVYERLAEVGARRLRLSADRQMTERP